MMPTIEPFDGERTLPEGERLKLICKSSGSPRPTLYWYRDGRRLEGNRDDHRRDQPEPSPPPSRSRYIFRATQASASAYDAINSFVVLLIENICRGMRASVCWELRTRQDRFSQNC